MVIAAAIFLPPSLANELLLFSPYSQHNVNWNVQHLLWEIDAVMATHLRELHQRMYAFIIPMFATGVAGAQDEMSQCWR